MPCTICLEKENERLKSELTDLRAKLESAPDVEVSQFTEYGGRVTSRIQIGHSCYRLDCALFDLKPGETRKVRLVEVD